MDIKEILLDICGLTDQLDSAGGAVLAYTKITKLLKEPSNQFLLHVASNSLTKLLLQPNTALLNFDERVQEIIDIVLNTNSEDNEIAVLKALDGSLKKQMVSSEILLKQKKINSIIISNSSALTRKYESNKLSSYFFLILLKTTLSFSKKNDMNCTELVANLYILLNRINSPNLQLKCLSILEKYMISSAGNSGFEQAFKTLKGILPLLKNSAREEDVCGNCLTHADCKNNCNLLSKRSVRKAIILLIFYIVSSRHRGIFLDLTTSLIDQLCRVIEQNDKILTYFLEDDSHLVQLLLYSLDCFEFQKKIIESSQLNPFNLFAFFLNSTEYDHTVILDLLMSPETEFLTYFVRILKLIIKERRNFLVYFGYTANTSFKTALQGLQTYDSSEEEDDSLLLSSPGLSDTCKPCLEESETFKVEFNTKNTGLNEHLDQIFSCLIRLRLSIERLCDKQLFPYDAKPLINLLYKCDV
ncbi:unnamed protein product [Dimorphilus gyrociliatus]|uniref:Uncharacterized protein n=1 Tax=Dimorphilus gyrociliatus TaxID=2664684 RepID=A0A7I8V934_9ANNE|nr:unnamed protein product [Dimorphilus gyrociliatus]